MRNSSEKITQAIDLYFSSMSSRKVRNFFRRHLVRNSSHVTILDWARRYTMKVQNYTQKLNPTIGGNLYADETEIDCQKRNDMFWVALDWDTRFITGTHYSTTRDVKEATTFIRKNISKTIPKSIQTDAYQAYPAAIKTAIHFTNRKAKIEHRINNVSKTGKHNVRIETVFSKIKDRVRNFRGLKSLSSAPILMQGIVLQHNFIEAHTTTNQIPCELANLKLETGQNRWLGLIKLASN